jgi:hypothetical protein
MRRRTPIASFGVAIAAGAFIAAGLAAVPAGVASADATVAPTAVSLPITGYYQMAVDSADSRVFISQGSTGADSILVTDFSGNIVGTIAEPSAVEGIALSPNGSTLYAVLVGSSTVSPAISVISAASLAPTTTYPLPAGDTPQDVAVQSGKLWVSYGTGAYSLAGIGDFDLSAASPVLETQSAMSGGWYSTPPMLAADPTGTGNVLVATQQNVLDPTAVSYDTSADPVTVRAQGALSDCAGDDYDYAIDIAVVPGGAGFILACDAPQKAGEELYSTGGLKEQRSYPTIDADAIAFAASTGLVAGGSMDVPQIADVYTAGGVQTNQFKAVGTWPLADRGLGLNAAGTKLFAVTSVVAGDGSDFALNMFQDPAITGTSLTLAAAPASTTVGKPVTLSGTLGIGISYPNSATIKITRTGGGQPATTSTADVRFAGGFTWFDYPPVAGTFTYTASYPATATTAASSASVTVTVAKATPSLSFTVTPATANYGTAVRYTALVNPQSTPASTLTVYAQPAGGARTKIASRTSSGNWEVTGTLDLDRTTTLSAVYSGNAANAAATVTKTVDVYAKVTAAISGYYGSASGSRLYHRSARVDLSVAVAPAKVGECVQFQVQDYVKKVWQAVATTGCATLNSKSEISTYLVASKYALGVPYRVRADYVRSMDTANLDADSGFLYFTPEK